MRPVSLTVQAFESYGEKTTIDFTKPQQNLFLIAGDTGAGKTTIFDAIVFALYGEASSLRNGKGGEELQSQFADSDAEPFAELKFSEKNGPDAETYTVRRVPRHTRAKKRGKGLTGGVERVSLIMPGGNEYANNLKETNKKIEEIVGLNKQQFMQIAMIAQGEFMELLRAKSNDRKEIFRKLFNTELYDKIARELNDRRKEKLSEIDHIKTIFRAEVGHSVIPKEDENAEKLSDLRAVIISADKLNAPVMDSFLAAFRLLCDRLREKENAARDEYENAAAIRDKTRDAITHADDLMRAFDQLEEAKKESGECEKAEDEIAEAARLAASIDSAYEIKAVYESYRDAAEAFDRTTARLDEQRKMLPDLERKCGDADAFENEKLAEQKAASEAYARVEERVNTSLNILRNIQSVKKDLASAGKRCLREKENTEKAMRDYGDYEARVKNRKSRAEELKGVDVLLERWRRQAGEADGLASEVSALKQEKREVESQKDLAGQAREAYADARDLYNKTQREYTEKQKDFFDAQAGILAEEKLVFGEPCPVCGSRKHPNPSKLSEEHRGLTREKIDDLARQAAACQEDMRKEAAGAQSAAERLEEKEKNFAGSFEKLKSRMSESLSDVPCDLSLKDAETVISTRIGELSARGVALRKDADTLAVLEENLKNAEAEKGRLDQLCDEAQKEKNSADTALSNIRIRLEELEKQKDYATAGEAGSALAQAKNAKEDADEAFSLAHKTSQDARAARDGAKTLIARYKEELPGRKKERDTRGKAYATLCGDKDISEKKWTKIAQRYQKGQADALREKVRSHGEKKAAARRLYDSMEKKIGDEKRPDMEELKAANTEADKQLKVARNAYEDLSRNRKVNEEVSDKLSSMMGKNRQVMEEHARIERMYDRLAGNVSGGHMDIESFVQRYYLRRILEAANARFRKMSAGQFELRMVDEEQAGGGRSNQSLDLIVYSTVTGRERAVNTLSGGESFIAALSLALGMADQIRMHSAVINLDIMFIDEGFGSLDDNSRNQAVKVLQQMAGGDKLVGIISHVTELKQQIDDQLVIRKDDRGSHACWQIS